MNASFNALRSSSQDARKGRFVTAAAKVVGGISGMVAGASGAALGAVTQGVGEVAKLGAVATGVVSGAVLAGTAASLSGAAHGAYDLGLRAASRDAQPFESARVREESKRRSENPLSHD